MLENHEATLRSAYAKLPVLQVRLQGGPCLAQEQVTKDLGSMAVDGDTQVGGDTQASAQNRST